MRGIIAPQPPDVWGLKTTQQKTACTIDVKKPSFRRAVVTCRAVWLAYVSSSGSKRTCIACRTLLFLSLSWCYKAGFPALLRWLKLWSNSNVFTVSYP